MTSKSRTMHKLSCHKLSRQKLSRHRLSRHCAPVGISLCNFSFFHPSSLNPFCGSQLITIILPLHHSSFPSFIPIFIHQKQMAHGSNWTKEQVCYIIIMKIGTEFLWREIAARFRDKFPGTRVNNKDCESKFNKELKSANERLWVENFKRDGSIPACEEGGRVIGLLVLWLGEIPLEDREL